VKRLRLVVAVLLLTAILLVGYILSTFDSQQSSSLDLVNTVGLATVAVGIAAALIILRRASPPS